MGKLESVEALQRLAAARFSKYQRELFKARNEEWQLLPVDHPIFMHWVHHAFRVIEERLIQDAEERIRIYKEVSRDYARPDLLRREHLQRLRDDITGGMNLLCQVLEDEIQKAATARYFTGPLPGVAQYDVLRGHVLDGVIAFLDELEAEGVAADDRAESLATPAAGKTPAEDQPVCDKPAAADQDDSADSAKRGGRPKGTPVNAAKLRELRELADLTQEGLAKECDKSLSTIQRGEAGATWSDEIFKTVARVLSDRTGKANPVSSEDLKNLKN